MPSVHPEVVKEQTRRRNSARKAREYGVYDEPIDSLLVLERADGTCGICGEDVDPLNYTLDHIRPFARGGRHSYDNVQIAHPRCNSEKMTDGRSAFVPGTPAATRDARVRERDEKIVTALQTGATYAEVAAELGVSYAWIKLRVKAMRADGRTVPGRRQGQRRYPNTNGAARRRTA